MYAATGDSSLVGSGFIMVVSVTVSITVLLVFIDNSEVKIASIDREKYLIYISTYWGDNFFVSLENSKPFDDLPYEPVGDFDNLDLKGLEKLLVQHLRL